MEGTEKDGWIEYKIYKAISDHAYQEPDGVLHEACTGGLHSARSYRSSPNSTITKFKCLITRANLPSM
jgi:hypothetical protein